jgi:hypothetical protein
MSRPKKRLLGILAVLWVGVVLTVHPSPFTLVAGYAAEDVPLADGQMPVYMPRKESLEGQMPIYKPRKPPSVRGRLGGHTRGENPLTPSLIALVPDHVAFTIKNDTALCWYLSTQSSRPLTFTVSDSQGIRPLLETALPPPVRAGIHCVHLRDYGVTLKEQEPYRWFVTLAVDQDRPSRDVVAGGMIERIPYDEACMLDLPCSGASCDRAAVYRYAASGLWYDAITCLLALIDHDRDPTLYRMLEALLHQSGIDLPTLDLTLVSVLHHPLKDIQPL